MSYILQALKKSEQERQRGSIPNLQSSQIIVEQTSRQRSIWLRTFVVTLALSIAALLYWFQPWQDETSATQSASASRKQSETPMPAIVTSSDNLPPVQQTSPQQQSTSPPPSTTIAAIESVEEPHPIAAVARKVIETPSIPAEATPELSLPEEQWQKITPSTPRNKVSVKQGLPQPKTVALAKPAVKKPAGAIGPESKSVLTSEEQWQKISPSSPQKVTATHQTSAIPASQPAIKTLPKSELPSVHELPANIQQSLPAITIAAHIYSGDPGSRMTIINNKSLREGQSAGAGLVLEEITRNGVILKFQGKRFRLGKLQAWRK